jgi:hypothetical protein
MGARVLGAVAALAASMAWGDEGPAPPQEPTPRPVAGLLLSSPGLPPSSVERMRAELSHRFRLVNDASVRETLEGFAETATPAQKVKEALARAHEQMRTLDLALVRRTLARAQADALHLPPSPEGRQLAAEVGVREAMAALLAHEPHEAERAMRHAFSADPSLSLDARKEPPPLIDLEDWVRTKLRASSRVSVRVTATPLGARLRLGSQRGTAPAVFEGVPTGPQVVWAEAEGYASQALWFDAGPEVSPAIVLQPLGEAQRLRPLIDAVRQTDGDQRRAAALALLSALKLDALVIAGGDPDVAPVVIRPAVLVPNDAVVDNRRTGPIGPPPPVVEPPSWYQHGWVWVVIGGGALLAGGAAALTVRYFTGPTQVNVTCCH